MTAARRRAVRSRRPKYGAVLAGFLAVWALMVVGAATTAEVRRGLDLQGGIGVVLTAPPAATVDIVDKAIAIIRNRVDALGVGEPDITRQGDRNIQVQLPGVRDRQQAIRIVGTTAQLQFRPVLDVLGQAGLPDPEKVPDPIPAETDTVPVTSTVEPTATVTATDSVPTDTTPSPATNPDGTPADTTAPPETTAAPIGSSEATAANPRISGAGGTPTGIRAQLAPPTETATPAPTETLPPVMTETPPPVMTETSPPVATETAPPVTTPTVTGVTPPEQDLTGSIVVLTDTANVRYRLGPAEVIGADVKGATAAQQQSDAGGTVIFGGWEVRLEFTGAGEAKYKSLTGRLACNPAGDPTRQIAIVLDHVVESAPQVSDQVQCNQGIEGGGIITVGDSPGRSQQAEAQELATILRYGALPAPFTQSAVQEISATLGRESLRAGLIAAIVGLTLVAIYAILYYRALGLIIVVGLFIFGGLTYSIVAFLSDAYGLTLSLAGIAGVIVSIGITVDSYVVYFERIKEEVKAGRTVRSAVEKGFQRSFRTIVTADLVSFGAAAILYLVAVSSVKGFALLLGISSILDVVVVWFFKRPVVALLVPTKFFSEARFMGLSNTAIGRAQAEAQAR